MTSSAAFGVPESGPPSSHQYSPAIAALAWAVILGVVAIVGFSNWRASRTVDRTQALGEYQFVIASRIAIGSHSLLSGWQVMSGSAATQMIDHVRAAALTPADKLRAICVVGDVEGPDAAMRELDHVEPLLNSADLKRDAAALRTIYRRGAGQVPAEEREELVRRHGWFGRLALSFEQPPADPLRREVIHRAQVTFVALLAFELVSGLGLLAGVVLLVLAIVLLAVGNIHFAYRSDGPPATAFLEAFALYLVGFTATGVFVRGILPEAGVSANWFAIPPVLLAMFWPVLRGVSWAQLRRGLGWHTGRGLFIEIWAGIGGYLAGLPIIAAALAITAALMTRSGASAAHPIMFANPRGVWPVVQLYLLASVWAPLVEETMFRGALFHHLRQRHGWWLSALLSSFLFAAIHPQGWVAIPALGAIALVLAAIRQWRGTMFASAAAHALNNGVLVTLLIVAFR